MTFPQALAEWLALKLWILYYNLQLTPEERAENRQLLKEWERERRGQSCV